MTDDYVPGSLRSHDCPGCGLPIAAEEERCPPCLVDLTAPAATPETARAALDVAREALRKERMADGAKAPKREDGTYLYVVETTGWGRITRTLVAATSLAEAKREHGWTRARHEYRSVHRAALDELSMFADYHFPPLAEALKSTPEKEGNP